MKIKAKNFFFLFLFSIISNSVYPCVMGAEISWDNVGTDSFLVTLIGYNECVGMGVGNATLRWKCKNSGQQIGYQSISPSSPESVIPVCNNQCSRCDYSSCAFPYGYEKFNYTYLVVIDSSVSCCEIVFFYSSCCRNSQITTGPGNTNFYIESMFNKCLAPQNSSPHFENPAFMINCLNNSLTFNNGATDNDTNEYGLPLDSLSTEWTSPLSSPTSNVSFSGQYSFTKPVYFWGFPNANLNLPKGIHLNNSTGDISFRPTKVEQTLLTIKVCEWRKINGIYTKIGEVMREFQFNIINCSLNYYPTLSGPFEKTIRAGNTITFSVQTADGNPNDTVSLAYKGNINTAIWTDNSGSVKRPSGSFTFYTDTVNQYDKPLYFYVNAKDDHCPLMGSISKAYKLNVINLPPVQVELPNDTLLCKAASLTISTSIANCYGQVSYLWNNGKKSSSITTEPLFQNSQFSVMVIDELGSVAYDTINVQINQLQVSISSDSTICLGDSIDLASYVSDNMGSVAYQWSSGQQTSTINSSSLYKDQVFSLTVTDTTGCQATDSNLILVNQFDIDLIQDSILCSGENVELQLLPKIDESDSVLSCQWIAGNSQQVVGITASLMSSVDAMYYCSAMDNFGCKASDSIHTTFHARPIVIIDSFFSVCKNEYVNLDTLVQPKNGLWSCMDSNLIHGHLFNSYLADTGFYKLHYIFSDSNRCETSVQTDILIYGLPAIKMNQFDSMCASEGRYFLSALPNGGLWSGEGVDSNYFDPSQMSIIDSALFNLVYNVEDQNQCQNSDTLKLKVFEQIEVEAGDSQIICINASAQNLMGDPIGGFWIGKGIIENVFNPSSAGSGNHYAYYFFLNGNCISIDSMALQVTELADSVIARRHDTLFVESGMKSYQWYFEGQIIEGSTQHYQLVDKTGLFYVIMEDSLGCVYQSMQMYFSAMADINKDAIHISPNPANGYFILNSSSNETINLLLLDQNGKTVLHMDDISLPQTVYTHQFASGIYTIVLLSKTAIHQKLVLLHN